MVGQPATLGRVVPRCQYCFSCRGHLSGTRRQRLRAPGRMDPDLLFRGGHVPVAAGDRAGRLRAGAEAWEGTGAIGWRQRLARTIGLAVGWGSIAVGIAGLLWHLEGDFFQEQTIKNLVYTAPF